MKNFFLLAFFILSLSVSSQVDSTRRNTSDDSLNRINNEALLQQLRKDSAEAVSPPDTLKVPEVKTDSVQPVIQQKDTVSTTPVLPDSVQTLEKPEKLTEIPKDTIRIPPPVIVKDSLRYKQIRASGDSIKYALLDSLTPEELLEYYLTEPEPVNSPKGHTAGDSLYNVLNPLTMPTTTVVGESLLREQEETVLNENDTNLVQKELRPKLSIGAGRLGYHGDLYKRHFQSVLMGKPAFDFAISQRLTRYLQLDFNFLFGKFGANEFLNNRHENIQTEIRSGGVNLMYDFGNFIPDFYKVRPFFSFGVYGFEFLSKTDLRDKDGKLYYYWSDGSIKDKAEGSADAQNANVLLRDFTYESDVREQNKDGFGKYRESAFAFPVGAGFVMKINDRIDLKVNYQYFITTTDYIDGISEKSLGVRKGNKRNDNFSYASVSIQYDLTAKKLQRKKAILNDTIDYNDAYLMALFYKDSDNDSIIDVNDACPETPETAKIDARGCPLDGDDDGVPDYRDDELNTVAGLGVNQKGVGLTDAYWQTWYDNYMNDTLPGDKTTEYTGNIYAIAKKKETKKDPYTVELVRYNGSIPSDELAFLLSIGDINSTTLEDGTTVVYTSGNYEKLGAAIKRRDEFREEGNKKAGVSMFKGRDVVQLPEDELESLLKSEIEDLLKLSIGDSSSLAVSNPTNSSSFETADTTNNRNEIVYRVQLGAFRNKISTSVFGASTGVLELKTGENVYRYVTKGYTTIEEAASVRADLVVQGYSDAFVTAYRGGRRIPMSETKATVEKNYKEDLDEQKTFNSIDKTLLAFKIQLGPLKKAAQETAMDEKVKGLGEEVQKQKTSSGSIRYTVGNFPGLELAEEFRKTLEEKGFTDAFIIATFKGEIISMQEAMELLK